MNEEGEQGQAKDEIEGRFDTACVIIAKQTIVAMLNQPVYKESVNEFAIQYTRQLGLFEGDIGVYKFMVMRGLEVMSIIHDRFYSMNGDPSLLRFGLKPLSIELGNFNNGADFIYWKLSEDELKIYKKKPIFWDKYTSLIRNEGK